MEPITALRIFDHSIPHFLYVTQTTQNSFDGTNNLIDEGEKWGSEPKCYFNCQVSQCSFMYTCMCMFVGRSQYLVGT